MATIKSVDVDDSPRTRVFRAIETILRTDQTLARVVAARSWRTYDGSPVTKDPFGTTSCPWVVMSRIPGSEDYWSPDALTGDMQILLMIGTRGMCEDDADNLYFAVQRAIYPTTQALKLANVQALQAAGAHTGIVTFSQPAFDPRSIDGQASDGMIVARGRMQITIRNTF
jgi:hypothetical protein